MTPPDGVSIQEEVERGTDGATSYEIHDALLVWCDEPRADSIEQLMIVELGRQFEAIGPVPERDGEFAFRSRSGDVVVRQTDTICERTVDRSRWMNYVGRSMSFRAMPTASCSRPVLNVCGATEHVERNREWARM